jgi:hypothetical protein
VTTTIPEIILLTAGIGTIAGFVYGFCEGGVHMAVARGLMGYLTGLLLATVVTLTTLGAFHPMWQGFEDYMLRPEKTRPLPSTRFR